MANIAVIGLQWGDEGKGKITDLLTPSFDVVARYQGGHNAGHTVYVGGKKIVLHLVPSGILHRDKICLIGNGVVVNPQALLAEIEELKKQGIDIKHNIAVSPYSHLILPYHTLVEGVREEERARKIGTTFRGIGPAYEDKVARLGIRSGDLLDLATLKEKVQQNVADKNIYLAHYKRDLLDAEKVFEEYAAYAPLMKDFIKDISDVLDENIREGKGILFEGAQGTLLDIDHGTYPYVTSSNSSVGGICTGLGISPDKIDAVLGVSKAYTTRVGEGPFPSELKGREGQYLLSQGNEYGATTGRPRRCGWLDTVSLAYACRLNGVQRIALTKPDVLDGLTEIRVCVAYRYKGERIRKFMPDPRVLEEVEPVYKSIRAWKEPVKGKRNFSSLPEAFKDYLKLIEDLLEVRLCIISTGVERGDTLFVEKELSGLVNLGKIKADL